jgi:hypothetical protein
MLRGHEGGVEGTGSFATGVVNRMSSDLKPVAPTEGFSDVLTFPHDQPPHLVAADILQRFGLPLLPNWVPLREKSSGRLFYGNALTKETTWHRPSIPPSPRAPHLARGAQVPSQKLWVGNLHPRADKRCGCVLPAKAEKRKTLTFADLKLPDASFFPSIFCSWLRRLFEQFGAVADA